MIEARELTKRYGDTTAVHSLSFTIAPGTVTGFLGPNGAGKSTTMRMIMGLDRPTSGTVTVNGKPYRQHRAPLREVGALLEASAVHPGRRTFALTEIMVRANCRRQGYARKLHDLLLSNRRESRATLLVLPDNVPARTAYIKWGWRKLGGLKPFDDAPTYDAMLIDLP
jgi:ABC-type multidrug transport system ATPase subunit